MDWELIVIIAAAVIAAASIAVLQLRGKINIETVRALRTLLGVVAESGDGLMERISYYCSIAVSTVEQLATSGQLDKKGEYKKEAAVELVKAYCSAENIELTEEVEGIIPSIVEAAVFQMKQS